MADFDVRSPLLGRERLTVSNVVKTLTASVYNGTQETAPLPGRQKRATRAIATVSVDSIFATRNGTDPSTLVGNTYTAGARIFLNGYTEIANFKMLRVTGDATVEVEYFQ